MSRYLLDANVSPYTAAFLRESLGLDVVHQRDILPGSPTDDEIIAAAQREQRVIITFDLGFGERYYQWEGNRFGAIVIRLRNQRRPSVEQALLHFFREQGPATNLDSSLVIIEERQVRVTGAE